MFPAKHSLGVLVVAMIVQLCPNDAPATTVSELLNAMQQRQLSIQDYDFVVNSSFFQDAFKEHEVEIIVEEQRERLMGSLRPTPENMERIALRSEATRLTRERSKFTGTLFQIQGIGVTTNSYAVYGFPDPQNRRMVDFLNTPPEDRDDLFELYTIPKPTMEFMQHRAVFPSVVVNGFPDDSSDDGFFVLPSQSDVRIEDKHTERYRSNFYPFWHEEALQFATVDNTTIVSESDDEIELLITVDDHPRNISFLLYCNNEGRVHRFIKKSNDETEFVVDYLQFAVMMPDGIEIPHAGRMWRPATSLDRVAPRPETTHISTILHGSINFGLTLDDLAIEVPEGTTILERRADREPGTITTTRPVRLGADLPEDIRELNDSDEE